MPSEHAKKSHLDIGDSGHDLGLHVDGFIWECLVEEADRIGVSIEELAAFAIAYYMADIDSGRVARKVPAFMRRRGLGRELHGLAPVEGNAESGQQLDPE